MKRTHSEDGRHTPEMRAPAALSSDGAASDRELLQRYVPHRPPMLLLDGLLKQEADGVQCRVDLRPDSPFVVDGHLPALVTLEHMAQAVAVYAGIKQGHGKTRVGYLVGVRDMQLFADRIAADRSLVVSIRELWSNDVSGSFEANTAADGQAISHARLSVFVPPPGEPIP